MIKQQFDLRSPSRVGLGEPQVLATDITSRALYGVCRGICVIDDAKTQSSCRLVIGGTWIRLVVDILSVALALFSGVGVVLFGLVCSGSVDGALCITSGHDVVLNT
jgi:hypothetical protein